MNGFSLSGTGTQTNLFVICGALCKNARSLQDNVPLQRSQQKVTAAARIVANNALLQTCKTEATIKLIYLIT